MTTRNNDNKQQDNPEKKVRSVSARELINVITELNKTVNQLSKSIQQLQNDLKTNAGNTARPTEKNRFDNDPKNVTPPKTIH